MTAVNSIQMKICPFRHGSRLFGSRRCTSKAALFLIHNLKSWVAVIPVTLIFARTVSRVSTQLNTPFGGGGGVAVDIWRLDRIVVVVAANARSARDFIWQSGNNGTKLKKKMNE